MIAGWCKAVQVVDGAVLDTCVALRARGCPLALCRWCEGYAKLSAAAVNEAWRGMFRESRERGR